MRRWSAALVKHHAVLSIFALERLVVPVNIDNEHWAVMVAHIRFKKIVYYDSISGGYKVEHAEKIMQKFHE